MKHVTESPQAEQKHREDVSTRSKHYRCRGDEGMVLAATAERRCASDRAGSQVALFSLTSCHGDGSAVGVPGFDSQFCY